VLGASTHEVAKCETRGGESEPLNPGTGGSLDQNSVEISYTGSLRVQRFEGATFDRRSHKVLRAEARENTWHIHQLGPAWPTGGHASPEKEVKPSLTFTSQKFAR
jgi:hypothetical protein